MMRQIDYYLSAVSPWTYLAGNRPQQVAARHGAVIRYKPLDPGALFARTGGLPLGERHESRQAYRLQELQRQSQKLAMPLTLRPAHFPTNPAPSAYAIIAAQEAGGGDVGALVQSLCAACWAQDRDIAADDVIRDCLQQAGFDPGLAFSGLLTGAEIYGRNLEEAVQAGVFGVPFFIVDDQRFWGQDRIEDLDRYLAGAPG